MRQPIAVVVALLALAGCEGENAGGFAESRPTVPFEERCLRRAEAEVDREIRCWRVPTEHREAYLQAWAAQTYAPYLCGPNPELAALLAAGTVRYDGVAAAAAIAELAALPCHADPAIVRELHDRSWFLEGTLPDGAPCTESLECREGFCPDRVCGRTCTSLPGPGAACAPDAFRPCAAGLACAGGVCVEPEGPGGPCDASHTCGPGLVCHHESPEGPARCVAWVGPGEACDEDHFCQEGLWCAGGRCETATLLPPGEPCGHDAGTRCAPHAECHDGVCRAYLPEGAACAPADPEAPRCYPWGAGCDEATGTCRTQPWVGDACEDDPWTRRCLGSFARCEDGTCVMPPLALPAPGDPCGGDGACGDDLICEGGACAEGCR